MVNTFEDQKALNYPRVVHLKTIKGKGYPPAEEEQTKWHSVKYVKLDVLKAETKEVKPPKFQEVFGQTLLNLARENENIIGVTPAMPSGSSMDLMMKEFHILDLSNDVNLYIQTKIQIHINDSI